MKEAAPMKTPLCTDAQVDLLAERLRAVGVGRREFLKVAAGLAAMGPAGFNARPVAAAPKLKPGEKLAKDQSFRYGGGGWWQDDPTSHDFNNDLYCNGVPALFAGLMKFNADHQSVLYVASKVTSNSDGSQWTFTIRKDSKWSDGSPCTARDFEWSWKRQLDPASAAPYAAFLYDIRNAQAFNKKEVTDPSQVGVRAKDDWTLEVTLEGPRGYFPVLAAYLAALPAHRASVEKHADKWTEAANIVCNGPFVLETWQHGQVMVLRKNKHFFGAKDVVLDKVTIPTVPVASGAPPYDNSALALTSLQTGDLKRLQSNPKTVEEVFRYPFPGTWYLIPQVTKPPFDNLKVRRAVAHAIDRANIVKVAQGFAIPAHAMIPPGFPGALDAPKIKAIQHFGANLAVAQLRGTPFEGGTNWPKVTLTMRDEALGSKPHRQGDLRPVLPALERRAPELGHCELCVEVLDRLDLRVVQRAREARRDHGVGGDGEALGHLDGVRPVDRVGDSPTDLEVVEGGLRHLRDQVPGAGEGVAEDLLDRLRVRL